MMRIINCCGLKLGPSQLVMHRRSMWHKQAKSIRRLFKSTLTFREIGKEIGVSPERARQIAMAIGITGRERRKRRSDNRMMSQWANDPLISKLPENVTVKPIAAGWRMSTRVVLIDGLRCRLACYCQIGRYYHLKPVTGRYDAVLYYGPLGWLVFPWRTRPRSATGFGLNPRFGTRGRRHDYLEHLARWDLLRASRRS